MNGLCRGISSKLQCDQASCKIAWKNSSIRSAGQWLLERAGDCIVDGISYAGGRKGPISCDGFKNVGEGLRQGLTYVFTRSLSSADFQQYSSEFEAQNPFDKSNENDLPPERFASNVMPDENKTSPREHSGSFNGDGRRYFHYDSTAVSADQVKKATNGGKGGGSRRRLPSSRARQTLSERSQEHKVPASRTERLASFGGLAVGLGVGTIAEIARRSLGINEGKAAVGEDSSPILSEANAERIVNTLCRVRGAALKLGQIISIQDNAYLNPQLQNIFERVRQSADFMPTWQMEKSFKQELGKDWKSKFASVEMKPFAAASIGQVHLGVLLDGREVAMKIQYPGVETSIDSDINNLMTVLRLWNVLPEGLYVDNAVAVARRELAWEVDYLREAESCKRMRSLLKNDPVFYVPDIVDEFSTKRLLTQELIYGVPLDKAVNYDQETRNYICLNVLRLCLAELFEFQFMQTDPNWSNFFYNDETKKISLLDFGACREYDKSFVDNYIRVIKAAQDGNPAEIKRWSKKLGFLTGYEPKVMLDAHIDAVMILGEAFASETPFDFSQQSVTERIKQIIPVMLKHRLTPPPEESYSLHRKMSGAFLLCTKLSAMIACKPLFDHSWKNYNFSHAVNT